MALTTTTVVLSSGKLGCTLAAGAAGACSACVAGIAAGSAAAAAGVRAGSGLVRVNGADVRRLPFAEVQALVVAGARAMSAAAPLRLEFAADARLPPATAAAAAAEEDDDDDDDELARIGDDDDDAGAGSAGGGGGDGGAAAGAAPAESLWAKAASAKAGWKCSGCLVTNAEAAALCACCEAPNPAMPAAAAAPKAAAASTFVFGAAPAGGAAPAFSFGAPAAAASAAVFTFGAPAVGASFGFGAPASAAAPAVAPAAAPAAAPFAFSFGAPAVAGAAGAAASAAGAAPRAFLVGPPCEVSCSLPARAAIEGRFCSLVPLSAAAHGADLAVAWLDSRPEAWTYLQAEPPGTLAEGAALAAKYEGEEGFFHFAVVDRASGKAVGTLGLLQAQTAHARIEIGPVVFTSRRIARSRISTEAVFLILQYLFGPGGGYRRVEWKCDALNEASRAAAVRLGFTFDAVFRQHMVVKGRSRDTAWYSMLAEGAWPRARAALEQWLREENFDAGGTQRAGLASLRQ